MNAYNYWYRWYKKNTNYTGLKLNKAELSRRLAKLNNQDGFDFDYEYMKKQRAKKKLKHESEMGIVYFIGSRKYRWVKIGITADLPTRLSQLQTSCPFDLEILSFENVFNPRKEEKRLHRLYKKYKVRGEWFKLPEWALKNPHS